MKYIVMYVICGCLWITWMFSHFDIYEMLNGKEGIQLFEETKRNIFKQTGFDWDLMFIKKFIVGIVFIFFVVTWPYQLFDAFVKDKIKAIIKVHKVNKKH